MTVWVDPLIAEAKQRARRRRVTIATVAFLAVGAIVATLAFSGSPASRVAPAATRTQLPPLSNLAARAMWCGDAYNASGHGGCHSPDGKWSVVVLNHGTGCMLAITRTSTGRVDRLNESGSCVPDLWAADRFLVLVGYSSLHGRVVSIDPASRHQQVLARLEDFIVSPDKRWIAGEPRYSTTSGPRSVAAISLATGSCRLVARTSSPGQSVSVWKSPWSFRPPLPTTQYKQVVFWRTVRQGGHKIRVVSGPGTGFTRNSRSVIVAKWQRSKTPPYAIHKRLVKLDLASLRAPCPAGLVPPG